MARTPRRRGTQLEMIANEATRRAAFRKRKKGVFKKAEEISTLCGVPACAVIYGPEGPSPEVWPSVGEAAVMLERFQALPELERTRKMMNEEKFMAERIVKTEAQISRVETENNEAKCTALVFRCIGNPGLVQELDLEALMSLAWTVDNKIQSVWDRIEALEAAEQPAASPPPPPPHPPPPPPAPIVAAPDSPAAPPAVPPPANAPAGPPPLTPNVLPPAEDIFAGIGDELLEMSESRGVFKDYDPQPFWPDKEDLTARFDAMPMIGTGDDDDDGYLKLPGVLIANSSSSSSSSANNYKNSANNNDDNCVDVDIERWLEDFHFHL